MPLLSPPPPSPPPSSQSPTTPPFLLHPPPPTSFTRISFPAPGQGQGHILQVQLSRPRTLNSVDAAGHAEMARLWAWFDEEPGLRVGIVTGVGRAFCAGQDLREWNLSHSPSSSSFLAPRPDLPATGFGGLSRRVGKKPIIAAVNGICLGGGCEMVINCDLVLASPRAVFGLPEAQVGVVASAGALPRLARTVGRQRAMEMALTGRQVSAHEARSWGLVNLVTDGAGEGDDGGVVEAAVRWARMVADNSPDSVIVSKAGVEEGWTSGGVEDGTDRVLKGLYARMDGGQNMKEGIRAFVEKRKPRWVDSKL